MEIIIYTSKDDLNDLTKHKTSLKEFIDYTYMEVEEDEMDSPLPRNDIYLHNIKVVISIDDG